MKYEYMAWVMTITCTGIVSRRTLSLFYHPAQHLLYDAFIMHA